MNVMYKLNSNEAKSALKVVFQIMVHGFDAFLVGGCVRDLVLGKTPKDFDVATNMPVEDLSNLFSCHDIGKSKDFGIVVVNVDGFSFEVANFRVDGEYSDSRRPDYVTLAKSLKEDVMRRDFTVNALALGVNGNVVDYVGGLEDLKSGVLRTVGNPYDRFNEDPLRVVRAVRFAGMNGFRLDDETKDAMSSFKGKVNVSVERVKDELVKMASGTGKQLSNCVRVMDEVGLLDYLLPEVYKMKLFPENEKWHPEAHVYGNGMVFDHVMSALKTVEDEDYLVNLGVLFHDLGKPHSYSFDYEKGNRYHGHADESARVVESLCKRLKFSNDETTSLVYAAKEHMNLHKAHKMKKSSMVRHFKDENFELLVKVVKADDSCRLHMFDEEEYLSNVDTVRSVLNTYKENSTNKTKLVSGNLVMEVTDASPGKVVGQVIEEVTNFLLDEEYYCVVKKIKEVYGRLNDV